VNDYYGINNVCLSLPTVVSREGVERALKIHLSEEEERGLKNSASVLRKTIAGLEL
jgi:L-lactate dehydrogenase